MLACVPVSSGGVVVVVVIGGGRLHDLNLEAVNESMVIMISDIANNDGYEFYRAATICDRKIAFYAEM